MTFSSGTFASFFPHPELMKIPLSNKRKMMSDAVPSFFTPMV
jgi:hypothetical protein